MSRRSATTTKVFVGNLPANATAKDLRELFAPYGTIAECDIAIRCGFLHLEDRDLAMKAIEELNNTTFMGVRISVEKGRVKPAGKRGPGPFRGSGKERGGPYSRDNLGRPPRTGGYGNGREYAMYGDRYAYERGGRYDEYADRRPMYDDRRMGDPYGRSYPNGYAYDERAYMDVSSGSYDDRYLAMGADRRSVVDPSMTQSKAVQPSYDRTQTDMYSRRDTLSKPVDRATASYSTTNAGYSVTPSVAYAHSTGGWVSSGGYGDNRATSTAAYDTRSTVQPGAYGDSRSTMTQAYDTRATASQMPSSMYSDTRSAAVGSMGSYSSTAATSYGAPTTYTTIQTTGYDTYGTARDGSYDASYPPLPQQRSYASGGGPAPRRDMPPGPGRRY